MDTKIQQIKNENSKEFASLKQIIQQKDELIVSLQGTITRNYEEMLTIRQNINQANMKVILSLLRHYRPCFVCGYALNSKVQ